MNKFMIADIHNGMSMRHVCRDLLIMSVRILGSEGSGLLKTFFRIHKIKQIVEITGRLTAFYYCVENIRENTEYLSRRSQ